MNRPRKLITIGHSYVVGLDQRLALEMAAQSQGVWEVTTVAPRRFHGPELDSLLRQGDLIHCWEEPFIMAGAQIAMSAPRSALLVFATFQNLAKRYPPFNLFERYAMSRASGWIPFARSIVEMLGSRAIYSRCPMRQIPPGVDLQSFRPDPESGARTRRSLGWESDGPPVVGYLGRFTSETGIEDLMAALDAVRSPWRALFVGAGPMEAQLRRWGDAHGGQVRICSNVDHAQVPEYLNAMDMLAAPSRTTPQWREQFGQILIEAFACGLPVLGSSSGEIPYVIGDAGRILPECDPAAWAEEIGRLIDNPQQRREIGARGLARAHERFSWSVVARQHLDFFDALLETRSPALLSPPRRLQATTETPRVSSGATKTRKLLSVGHSYAVGVNRRLAHEMALAGKDQWDVTAVAPRYFHGTGDLRPVRFSTNGQEPCRVEAVSAQLTRFVHLFAYGDELKQILQERWDLIHAWEEPYIFAGYQIARWAQEGVPLVFRTAQSLPKHYPLPFDWIEAHNMARAAGWICSGKLVAEALGARDVYQRRPVRLIPLGVDMDFYKPRDAGIEQTLAELGWEKNGPPVVGFVGRFVAAKGLRLLTEALDELRMPWRALFIGAGAMEGFLRRWGQKYGGRVQVCTDVHHHDVPRYLSVMNVMCAPSQTTRNWREQFGRMLIEAFAAGVPVIGSDSGEIPFVIADAGVVCGEKDHHAWVRELRLLLDSPALRADLSERGLQRARENYAWPVVARQYIDFFDEIASMRVGSGAPIQSSVIKPA